MISYKLKNYKRRRGKKKKPNLNLGQYIALFLTKQKMINKTKKIAKSTDKLKTNPSTDEEDCRAGFVAELFKQNRQSDIYYIIFISLSSICFI